MISIIMPNFNKAIHIRSAIESVLQQTYKNWELIIIDDCSIDGSSSIIHEYVEKDYRIKFLQFKKNSGTPGIPRNAGLKVARGKYIAFLDSDDIWHPQKLEIQLNFMINNNIHFSFTNVIPFIYEKEIKEHIKNDFLISNINIQIQKINYSILLRKNFIKSCSTVLLSKKYIGKVRFNNDTAFKAVEDYLFWLYILKTNCSYAQWINISTTYYRESDTSISKSKIFMIKQNYKLYDYIFHNRRNKWLKIVKHMFTYAYYSSKNIISKKKPVKIYYKNSCNRWNRS